MLSLTELSSLVPAPRGPLSSMCSAGTAVIVVLAAAILIHEKVLGWVSLLLLLLTSGPLLHGCFLLLEETINHKNRYRGRSCLAPVAACGLKKSVLSVGLSSLLLSLSGSPLPLAQLWPLLSLGPVLYTACRSLGVLAPSEVELSEICEGRKMNVAHGLAWSFYLGYLQIVLPRLGSSIEEFCSSHSSIARLWSRGSQRLLLLIPVNAHIPHKLEEEDDRIKFCDSLPNAQLDRGGIKGRVYKHSVYTVQDHKQQAHACVVEYATPLLTLYSMSQDNSAGFGERDRRQQVLLFYRTLRDVLERSLECRNRYTLILLNDEHEDDPHYLSKAILSHLQQQDTEEYPMVYPQKLAPQQEQNRPSSCRIIEDAPSKDPTLMFSPPCSLRGPEEVTDCYRPQIKT